MKLLPLEPSYRGWLTARSALGLDSDLNEKFVGLTHLESLFYADITNGLLTSLDVLDETVLTRFLELHERHELIVAFQTAAARFMAR